ncbi:MAG: hypothetical protein RL033_387 [Pseudomonadota bacterium]|jgi:hypothetical protein
MGSTELTPTGLTPTEMTPTALARLEQLARRRYELGRLRRAALGALPLLPLVLVALCLTQRPTSTLCFGSAALGLALTMLWYGRAAQRAVLPGMAAGVVPLALSLCANQIHHCGMNGCSSFCAPACTLGGSLAGLGVMYVARRRGLGFRFLLGASGVALLTGAMGCTCVGYSGVLGLGVGFLLGLFPSFLRFGRAAA